MSHRQDKTKGKSLEILQYRSGMEQGGWAGAARQQVTEGDFCPWSIMFSKFTLERQLQRTAIPAGFLKSFQNTFCFMCRCLCLSVCNCIARLSCLQRPGKDIRLLELELRGVMSHCTGAGNQSGSSARAARLLSC